YLGKCFSMKDLGEAAYILGIKIYRDRSLRLIGLNQSSYINKILKKFNMQNSKKDEKKAYMKKVPYASPVGSIMYAVRKFVGDLGVMPSINKPINMYCDNSAAIIFANEPGVMKGAKHFLRRYHYVREQVESGEIKLIKVHTDKNLADAFTKALPRGKVNEHANGIG
nr:retrotransposon protein, putative, Ty1-copia subclass [Tanacetum cinerariifolium]